MARVDWQLGGLPEEKDDTTACFKKILVSKQRETPGYTRFNSCTQSAEKKEKYYLFMSRHFPHRH